MTGPEHYSEAERLLAVANDYEEDNAPKTAATRRAAAQVHATLALAAATALAGNPSREGLPSDDWKAWYAAVSVKGSASRD